MMALLTAAPHALKELKEGPMHVFTAAEADVTLYVLCRLQAMSVQQKKYKKLRYTAD
jgi:hypothetical protein